MKIAMHVAMLLVGLPSLASAARGQGQSQTHPVGKVIKMLEGLKTKTESMGKAEADSYSQFVGWCQEQSNTLSTAIDDEKAAISELGDTIAGKTKEQEGLEKQIDDLSDQIADLEASALKAKNVRADEEALYKKSLEDYKGTIKAVSEALEGVKKAGVETKTGLLLAQQKAKKALDLIGTFATEEQRDAISTFLQQDAAPLLAKGDKSAALEKYDFKSGNVLELLKAMKAKFQDDKVAATKAETNAANAYELSSKAQEDARQAAEGSKSKKSVDLAEVKKALADAKGDLKDQKADLEVDSETLSETEKGCSTKKQEWEERSKTRDLELEAMDTAMKILAKVTGVRSEQPKNPGMPASPVSLEQVDGNFLQLHMTNDGVNPKLKAVNLLKETAKMVHSRSLERLAQEISAHLNAPFDQVNNMVQKMIFRLMDEQTNEDKHKAWCDQELSKTKASKENKDDKLEELDAKLKTEKTDVQLLTEEMKAADEMISKIVASTKKATEIRNIGKQENKEVIADAEAAQKAILGAIDVLQSFYQDAAGAAFLEAPVKLPKSPSTWDSGYTGVADPQKQPDGIISVLKAVNADFSKLEAETKSQETTDQQAYDEQVQKEAIEKARRTKEVEMKGNRRMQKSDAVNQMTLTRKNVDEAQEKAAQYLKDLEPACVSGDSSYEKRKKARDAEIEALQRAQEFLETAFEKKGAVFLSKAQVHIQKHA